MARVVLDTNAWVALVAGDQGIADVLSTADAVILPSIVLGELLDGFLGGTREEDNRRILARFRNKPRTVVAPITADTAEWFAVIKQGLRRKGRTIPINDVWIAACAMEHGAQLLTLDGHFKDIEGLVLVRK